MVMVMVMVMVTVMVMVMVMTILQNTCCTRSGWPLNSSFAASSAGWG